MLIIEKGLPFIVVKKKKNNLIYIEVFLAFKNCKTGSFSSFQCDFFQLLT